MTTSETSEMTPKYHYALWLFIGWVWVGIPLSWGIYNTVQKSIPLFNSPAPVQSMSNVSK